MEIALSDTNTPAPAPVAKPAETAPEGAMMTGYSETISASPEQIRMWAIGTVLEHNGIMVVGRGADGVIEAAAALEEYVSNGKTVTPAA